MRPHEKAAILKGLKAEEAARLREQDTHRKVLKDIENSTPSEGLPSNLDPDGWHEIEMHMEGQCWPPTSQDWLKFAGREHYETPKQELLNQIADEDIRFHSYHYSELADQTQRIKAMAHFFSLVGGMNDNAILAFWAWTEGAKIKATLGLGTPDLSKSEQSEHIFGPVD